MNRASLALLLGGLLLAAAPVAFAAAPVIVAIPDMSLNASTVTTINVVAYDTDNDPIVLTSSLPAYAALNGPITGTGLVVTTITLNPLAGDVGTANGSVTATANGESTTENFQVTVHAAGSDLSPVVTAPANQSVNEGSTLTFTVTASDAEAITALAAAPLPSGATFTANSNFTSGTFTWTPSSSQSGDYDVVFTASNVLSGSAATHIHVNDVGGGNTAPDVTAPANQTVNEGSTLTFTVNATDANGDHVTLTATNVPSGATFTDNGNNTGTFTWMPGSTQSGTYTVTFTGNDGHGGTDVATTVITVNDVGGGGNTAPDVTAPANQTVNEGQMLTFTVNATDANGDHVTLTATNVPSGATFTDNGNNTGTFTWMPGSTQSGSYTVTFTGNDGHGGTDVATTVITVNDVNGGGGNANATVTLIGAYNTHKKYVCFRVAPLNGAFDVRNIDMTSIMLSFNGSTLSPSAQQTHLDFVCGDDREDEDSQGEDDNDDDEGDCGTCSHHDHHDDGGCPTDTTGCTVTLQACFLNTALRTFFGGDVVANLPNATISGNLTTGGTFTATLGGSVKVAGGGDNNGDKGKGHDKHALHAKATPNPLNPQTKLTFTLSKSGPVRVAVYDIRGRYVKTLLDATRSAGEQTLTWDGSDSHSRKVSSGVYLFRIQAPEAEDIQRVTVLK